MRFVKEPKARLKIFVLSFLAALVLSGLQIWASVNFSRMILWQVNVMQLHVGPGPIIGYGPGGNPMYEGTPVIIFTAFYGLILGIAIYTTIFYFVLRRKIKKHLAHGKAN